MALSDTSIMKMEIRGDTLHISSVMRLGEANARSFRDCVVAQLGEASRNVAVDLSQTTFIDSSGLGALVALQKAAAKCQGSLSILNPRPSIQQILQLTRLDSFFQIVNHEAG